MEGQGPHGLGFETYTHHLCYNPSSKQDSGPAQIQEVGKQEGPRSTTEGMSDIGQSPVGSGRITVLEIFKGNPLE